MISEIWQRLPPQRGERSLAGGERSEPPDRIGITIRTAAGVAGPPRAPAGARWSGRHGFQGFAKSAHPWLSSSRSFGAVRTTDVVARRGGMRRLTRYP